MLPEGFPEPAQLDYLNERAVMLHMRHLLNLHDFLFRGFDEEMARLKAKLIKVGWGREMIEIMFRRAAEYTRYEVLLGIDPVHGKKGYFHGS
jgi:hypothetical protein